MISLPQKPGAAVLRREHSPLEGATAQAQDEQQLLAQLALTHTPVEHLLYQVMLAEVRAVQTRVGTFSLRQLMTMAQLSNYSAVRRGLQGLINKLSIEHYKVAGGAATTHEAVYLVFTPAEIFARRNAVPFDAPQRTAQFLPEGRAFAQAIARLAERYDLSRRETQVALCCAQGLTNAEIGERLFISTQTVKFHLRHIYLKYGVRRRAELISRLLAQDE